MKIVAIIPARGGSKGIPLKNIQPVGGVPLISRSIRAARASKYINEVYVSTDSNLIANVAREEGAQIVVRPADISGDTASSESALIYSLEKIDSNSDYLVFLQCTSPFTTTAQIDQCIERIIDKDADSCLATVSNHRFLWKNRESDDEVVVGINHDGRNRKRRQDLAPEFMETGAVYVMRTKKFLEDRTRFCGKVINCNFDDESLAFEIDSPFDLLVARAIEQSRNTCNNININLADIKLIVFDFDGVFTDNKVYVDEVGREIAQCDRGDGMGISLLKKAQVPFFILSTEQNPIVLKRADKLGVAAFNNVKNKLQFLEAYLSDKNLTFESVCYVGNDVNDLECLKRVGLPVVPADAHESVKKFAKIILKNKGGNGAVRELCDMLLKGLRNE